MISSVWKTSLTMLLVENATFTTVVEARCEILLWILLSVNPVWITPHHHPIPNDKNTWLYMSVWSHSKIFLLCVSWQVLRYSRLLSFTLYVISKFQYHSMFWNLSSVRRYKVGNYTYTTRQYSKFCTLGIDITKTWKSYISSELLITRSIADHTLLAYFTLYGMWQSERNAWRYR